MANSKDRNQLEIEGEILNAVGYATFCNRIPLFTSLRIFNAEGAAASGARVVIRGSTELILPSEVAVEEIPAESSVEVSFKNLLNPKYLAELSEAEACRVEVRLFLGKSEICSLAAEVSALPMDIWSGLDGNAEMLASFVRPKMADCKKILAEAGLQLRTWGFSSEFSGYAGGSKNAVRSAAASVFAAVRALDLERADGGELSGSVPTGDITQVVDRGSARPLELALFVASCLEAAKLHPVLVLGRRKVGVGVWLEDGCFSSTVLEDTATVERYISEGVNKLSVVDTDDIFAHRNASFATSEAHFSAQLKGGEYEVCLDIRRCRIGKILPLPIKVETSDGYELLDEGGAAFDERPEEVFDASEYDLRRGASREEVWQRRLLDLSQKNNLLNFRRRDCLHIPVADAAGFCARLEGGRFRLFAAEGKIADFGDSSVKCDSELIDAELKSGRMRCFAPADGLDDAVASLIKKARHAEEEAGANTLYLAVGFLRWRSAEGDEKYAPVCLLPARLKRTRTEGIILELGEEYAVNTTLLEFLKREFEIDMRGVENRGLSPKELIALFRAKTAESDGFAVFSDAYISQFTFARYAMWADLKNNIDEFKKSPLIAGLLGGEAVLERLQSASEDDSDPAEVLTPLPCDSAQYSAVAESAKGTTFVLHGPPGTGKSQTITNVIANAVAAGKRVLFVAEKQAALQVVKRRLEGIGLGDFCLELYSGKTADKSEIIRKIENTLALAGGYDGQRFEQVAANIRDRRRELRAPLDALHKKRRPGVSVYEAVVRYLENRGAPEIMNVESTFYDGLTAQKLSEYEAMLTAAQAAAKECGGVYRSPFKEVTVTECTPRVVSAALCSAQVVLAELKHLRNYLNLLLDTFNQKVSKFTYKKLEYLIGVCNALKEGRLAHFFALEEGELYKFYNAAKRYDAETCRWLDNFKSLPDIEKFDDDIEAELDNWGENYRSSRTLLAVLKRINRCGGAVAPEDEAAWIRRAHAITVAGRQMLSVGLSAEFTSFSGINERRRQEFFRPLYEFHERCAAIFMDYNADAFNSVCVKQGEALSPLISGFVCAAVSFVRSADEYLKVIGCNRSAFDDCDLFEVFTEKCGALIENIDMLPAWCKYKATAKKMNKSGLTFMTAAMESGRLSGAQILSSFRKNIYRNFIQTNVPADEALSAFSASVMDECATSFAQALDEFCALTRERIRAELTARLPSPDTEGNLAAEMLTFRRHIKGARAFRLRDLFREIPNLLKAVAPCTLMSPSSVSQYLPAESGSFDLVIFDEASQIPTCEAVPALARAKSAVIVGDPKQMPPTAFFEGASRDDETETEDMESLLDDCLALGMPEKHLIWHYRSRHESLIAFSNLTYYSGRLCTIPSPDAMASRVSLRFVENGVYERGASKCNREEAAALVGEVIARLRDSRHKKSIGIVTFSTPQQTFIERLLTREIAKNGLEEAAYGGDEPLFVKNLENVQGDERDVILFSVCYGPDLKGKISLNFGPLNQFGGWRRLNVAVSRARDEMVVFSSMRYAAIDLSRTSSRGVAGLKSFLEFAEKGRCGVSARSDELILNKSGIGRFIADELEVYGYRCRCNVGVSDFKIDVAVVDPEDGKKFVLAILADGTRQFSVKDRTVMQVRNLKRANWNVYRLYSLNFFNNPKREIKRIKELLDGLTRSDGKGATAYKKPYREAKIERRCEEAGYILSGENDGEVARVLKTIVAAEEPISEKFLIKRVMTAFGIERWGVRVENKIRSLIKDCGFLSSPVCGQTYYYKSPKHYLFDRFRVEEGVPIRTQDCDFTPFDIISLVKSILKNKVSLYLDELVPAVMRELKVPRATAKLAAFVNACIEEGIERTVFVKSVSDRISLA